MTTLTATQRINVNKDLRDNYLPEFIRRMTYGDKYRYAWQILREGSDKVEYKTVTTHGAPHISDWVAHFSGIPVKGSDNKSKFTRGSLAISGKFQDDVVRWFCLDSDNARSTEAIHNKIIPLFGKHGIEYIFGESGKDCERGHLWVLVDCKLQELKDWADNMFLQADINWRDKGYAFELYPTVKENFTIRLELGLHQKTGQVHAIWANGKRIDPQDVTVDGANAYTGVLAGVNAWNNVKIHTALDLKKSIIHITRPQSSEDSPRSLGEGLNKLNVKEATNYGKFLYSPLNLPLPTDDLPPVVKKLARECQCINSIINKAMTEDLIEGRTGLNHTAGLYLYGLALWNDKRLSNNNHEETTGREWAKVFFSKYRFRGYDEHNWNQGLKEADKLIPKCETWERDFNLCSGCKYRNRPDMINPRKLYFGSVLKKTLIEERKLVTVDCIRRNTFPRAFDRLRRAMSDDSGVNVLLANDRSSGKTYASSKFAIELATQGRNVLVAVPDGRVATTWIDLLNTHGYQDFEVMSLRSHKAMFNPEKPFETRFTCPHYDAIQEWQQLGVNNSISKRKFCNGCDNENDCPFINQYTEVQDTSKRIIIIQHALFGCAETMRSLMSKNFSLLIVDEEFIKNLQETIKPSKSEVEAIVEFGNCDLVFRPLGEWLKFGGTPDLEDKIVASADQLQACKKFLDAYECGYNVDEYIRLFNTGYSHNTKTGFEIFHPLPPIKNKLLLNATPPVEMLRGVLHGNVEVFGQDEVVDIQSIHPDNRVYQNLSGYMSVTSMKGTDDEYVRLVAWLQFIAEKARTDYAGMKILVTTYKSMKQLSEDWILNNYPDVAPRITFNWREKGTNAYKDYQVQFLLAGLHYSEDMIAEEVYQYKNILNYWNRYYEKPLIPNPKPVPGKNQRNMEKVNVRKVHKIGRTCALFEYPDCNDYESTDPYCHIIEKLAAGESLQGCRLRPSPDFPVITWIIGKMPMPNLLITDVFFEQEMLGQYLNPEK